MNCSNPVHRFVMLRKIQDKQHILFEHLCKIYFLNCTFTPNFYIISYELITYLINKKL